MKRNEFLNRDFLRRISFLVKIALIFFLLKPAMAGDVNDETTRFLKKLDLNYYCLRRQGLKKFKCDLESSRIEKLVKECANKYGWNDERTLSIEKIGFNLLYKENGNWEFGMNSPPPMNGDFDFINTFVVPIANIYAETQNIFKAWAVATIESFPYSSEDESKNEFRIEKTKDGFDFIETLTNDDTVTTSFDPNGKALMSSFDLKGVKGVSKFNYEETSKGYLLKEIEVDFPNNSKQIYQYSYQTISGFWMLSKISMTISDQKKFPDDDALSVVFKNYKIN